MSKHPTLFILSLAFGIGLASAARAQQNFEVAQLQASVRTEGTQSHRVVDILLILNKINGLVTACAAAAGGQKAGLHAGAE